MRVDIDQICVKGVLMAENDISYIVSAIVFTTVVGLMLNSAGYAQFTILNPTTFLAGQGLLMAAIALSNTPIAKGASVALFGAWLYIYFLSINIPPPLTNVVYAILFVPSFIAVGLVLLNVGRG